MIGGRGGGRAGAVREEINPRKLLKISFIFLCVAYMRYNVLYCT